MREGAERAVAARKGNRSLFFIICSGILVVSGSCATGDHQMPQEELRTPPGYATWKQQFEALDQQVTATGDRYAQEHSIEALRAYELAVRAYLDHGFALYRAYFDQRHTVAGSEIIAMIRPYLETTANRLMDVAEEYVKHQSVATANAIATEIINRYTDLPLTGVQQRAETLLFQHRYRRDF